MKESNMEYIDINNNHDQSKFVIEDSEKNDGNTISENEKDDMTKEEISTYSMNVIPSSYHILGI
jgi:hypothetical protein